VEQACNFHIDFARAFLRHIECVKIGRLIPISEKYDDVIVPPRLRETGNTSPASSSDKCKSESKGKHGLTRDVLRLLEMSDSAPDSVLQR
jgi:hypothetical protein